MKEVFLVCTWSLLFSRYAYYVLDVLCNLIVLILFDRNFILCFIVYFCGKGTFILKMEYAEKISFESEV